MAESGMYGSYERTLDSKNRVVIPAKFLGAEPTLYMSKDLNGTITFRSKTLFDQIRARLEGLNQLNASVRDYSRYFFGNTLELTPDRSGRVTLPRDFLLHAAIKKDVVFLGLGSRFELYSKEDYTRFNETFANSKALDDLVAKLEGEGFKL